MSIAEPATAAAAPEDDAGDFMAEVRAKACFNLGPQMHLALDLQTRLRDQVHRFEEYLNSRDTGGTLLVAAAVDQILRSAAEGGSWFGNDDVPDRDDLVDELIPLLGDHNGVVMKDGVLDKFRRERARVESRARALVVMLESPPFLAEFNNAYVPSPLVTDRPYYDALAQLYYANLFSLYLANTDAGMEFFKRSIQFPVSEPPSVPPPNLPIYHTTRFHSFFRLEPDNSDLTFDNYDPATGTFNLETIALLKGLGDGVAAAYLSYHATGMAALVQLAQLPSRDRVWAGRVVYDTVRMLGMDGADEAVDIVLHWEYVVERIPNVDENLKRASPWVATSAMAVLALVGTLVGALKYRAEPDHEKKATHVMEAAKEVIALSGAVAESLNAAGQRLGKPVVNGALAAAARRLNLASAAVDVVMNSQQFMRDLYFNTDQAPATVIKLAGSTIGLMGFGWSVVTGASLAGPVGVAAALLMMTMVLTGTILEAYLADTYLEKFLNRGYFGTDRGRTEDPSQFHYRFYDTDMQFSVYLRLLLGVRMSALGWTVDVNGEEHTRYWVHLRSEHPLPRGTRIRLTQAGVRNPSLPAVAFRIGGPFRSQWAPGVTESWVDAAPFTAEPVCKGLEYSREKPIPGDHVGRYVTAEITLTDEASRVILQSLVSAATGAPIRHVPITRAMKVYVTAELREID